MILLLFFRIWNVAKLWVYKVASDDGNIYPKRAEVNSSHPSWGVMNVKAGDLIWVGSIGNQFQKGVGLSESLHELSYNGKQIRLWNFHSQPENSACESGINE